MELKFLGCGSAFNTELGNNSAFFKQEDGKILNLIDCGESVFKAIKDKNILSGVDYVRIIITHLHSDHIGSLSSLIYYCHYVMNIQIDVFYPDKDLNIILQLQGHNDREYDFIQANKIDISGNLDESYIRFMETEHIKGSRSYAINIWDDLEKERIIFSGDTSNSATTGHLGSVIYQDISSYGGVHAKFEDFHKSNKDYIDRIIFMHFDSEELIDKCKRHGYRVATDYLV